MTYHAIMNVLIVIGETLAVAALFGFFMTKAVDKNL